MLDSRFVNSLLKHFGDGSERLCVLNHDGVPAAMCLLRPRKLGIWASFLPSQAQIGPTLIQNPDQLEHLMAVLPGYVARLDFLCNDPLFGDLSASSKLPSIFQDHALTMTIRVDGSFEHYWTMRSKNLTKNIARYERRLEPDNITRELRLIENFDDIGAAIERYAALESKGWKGAQGTAIGLINQQGLFYKDLMSSFAATGRATVHEMWFNGQLAASRLMIANDNMTIILKTTYDESFEKYAPGRLLLRDVLVNLFTTQSGRVIEFYTDANADQLAWATNDRSIRHLSFYRSQQVFRLFDWMNTAHQIYKSNNIAVQEPEKMPSVEVFGHPDEFPPDVQTLFSQAASENFEFGVSWYRNLINEVFPRHKGIRFHVLRIQGRPVAILPLIVHKSAIGSRAESLGNYYTSVYSPVLEKSVKVRDLAVLLKSVRDALGPLASFRFAPMDSKSKNYLMLTEALKAAGFVPFSFLCFGNWFLPVSTDWATYLKQQTSGLRSTIKRMTKKLAEGGGRLELVSDEAGLERGLAAYQSVYAQSWKKPEPFPNFVPGLIRSCATQGSLRLGLAWVEDKPIAAQLWIVSNGKANIYKVAYDEAFKAYSPGTLLTAMLMEHVMDKDKVAEVDFLIGDDAYKKVWMSDRRERWGIIAYNPRTIIGLFGLGREVLGRALKPIRARLKSIIAQARKPENKI